ncbi:MAG TPA: hypothetical protein PK788_02205 [Gemmatimonadaceae bacterium]|nr:hypothetical protein [Gemmatimonadaceae bacterium]
MPERRAIAAPMRADHHASSSATSPRRSTKRSEISDAGLQSAVPSVRPCTSCTVTAPAGAAGALTTSDLKIHGCPSCQRRAPRLEITATGC